MHMLNHEFDSQQIEPLNKAFTKLAPKNMICHDHDHLVITYAWLLHMIQLGIWNL